MLAYKFTRNRLITSLTPVSSLEMARVFGSAARIALANRIAPRICTSHAMAHRAVVPVRAFAAAAAGGEYVTLEEDKQSLADILAKNSKVIAYYTARFVQALPDMTGRSPSSDCL